MTLPNTATLDSYGGALQNARPVTDPTTDRDATDANNEFADTAAMTHTTVRARVSVTLDPTTPLINAHDAVWGNANAVKPTIVHHATGQYDLTWPSTVQDELGVTSSVNFRFAERPNARSSALLPSLDITGPNTARLYMFNPSTLAAADGSDVVVDIAIC